MILDQPWPEDLDPARAGFKTRTITILRRHGHWDDPTRLDTLTADQFLAYETAGIAILTDPVDKGNAAIAWYRSPPPSERRGYSVVIHWDAADRQKLRRLAELKWAHQEDVIGSSPIPGSARPEEDRRHHLRSVATVPM